jgi:integrase
LSRGETQGLLAAMEGKHALMARVMYGSGLRLTELLRLRVGVRRLMLGFGGAGGNRCSPFSNSVI